nr:putative coat protein [Rhizoctonia zeae RNA virus 2]
MLCTIKSVFNLASSADESQRLNFLLAPACMLPGWKPHYYSKAVVPVDAVAWWVKVSHNNARAVHSTLRGTRAAAKLRVQARARLAARRAARAARNAESAKAAEAAAAAKVVRVQRRTAQYKEHLVRVAAERAAAAADAAFRLKAELARKTQATKTAAFEQRMKEENEAHGGCLTKFLFNVANVAYNGCNISEIPKGLKDTIIARAGGKTCYIRWTSFLGAQHLIAPTKADAVKMSFGVRGHIDTVPFAGGQKTTVAKVFSGYRDELASYVFAASVPRIDTGSKGSAMGYVGVVTPHLTTEDVLNVLKNYTAGVVDGHGDGVFATVSNVKLWINEAIGWNATQDHEDPVSHQVYYASVLRGLRSWGLIRAARDGEVAGDFNSFPDFGVNSPLGSHFPAPFPGTRGSKSNPITRRSSPSNGDGKRALPVTGFMQVSTMDSQDVACLLHAILTGAEKQPLLEPTILKAMRGVFLEKGTFDLTNGMAKTFMEGAKAVVPRDKVGLSLAALQAGCSALVNKWRTYSAANTLNNILSNVDFGLTSFAVYHNGAWNKKPSASTINLALIDNHWTAIVPADQGVFPVNVAEHPESNLFQLVGTGLLSCSANSTASFRAGNVGKTIAGSSVGFERVPAPAGYDYRYVNNTDNDCLVHALNAQRRPEDQICQHTVKAGREGMSIEDIREHVPSLRHKTFAVYLNGAWAASEQDKYGPTIVGPEAANYLLAAHTAPYAHWDTLVQVGQNPDTKQTDAAYKLRGNGVTAMTMRASLAGEEQVSEDAPPSSEAGKPTLGNMDGRKTLFGEALARDAHTVEIGGYDNIFEKVELPFEVKYNGSRVDPTSVAHAISQNTFEVSDMMVEINSAATSINVSNIVTSDRADAPTSVMLDYSNVNRGSGTTRYVNSLEKAGMAEAFKNANNQLKSVFPAALPNNDLTPCINKAAHLTSIYDDYDEDGHTALIERAWSGFLAACAGTPALGDEHIFGVNAGQAGAVPPRWADYECTNAGTIWPDATANGANNYRNALMDRLDVDRDGNLNAILLTFRHQQNMYEPLGTNVADPVTGNIRSFWAVAANIHQAHLGFGVMPTTGIHNQFVARYVEDIPPLKIIAPFGRSTTLCAGNGAVHYNRTALMNPQSYLDFISWYLCNVGKFTSVTASLTEAVRRGISFYGPITTHISAPMSHRFHGGSQREAILARRLLAMRRADLHGRIAHAALAGRPLNANQVEWNRLLELVYREPDFANTTRLDDRNAWPANTLATIEAICGANTGPAFEAIPALVFVAGNMNSEFATDVEWHNRFINVNILGNELAAFTATMTTQELTGLMAWLDRAGFAARWGVAGAVGDLRVNRNAQLADDTAALQYHTGWGSVDKAQSLTITNMVHDARKVLPAGLTQLRNIADGRFVHQSDYRAIAFAQTLQVTKPERIMKFVLMHALQMRAVTDAATMDMELSASYIQAATGAFVTGDSYLDAIIYHTSLSRSRPQMDSYVTEYLGAVCGGNYDIYTHNSEYTEKLSGRLDVNFMDHKGYLRRTADHDVDPKFASMALVSWRVFSPIYMQMLLPGIKSYGGTMGKRIDAFNYHLPGNRNAFSSWIVDSSITAFEVLGAKRLYISAAGLVPLMSAVISYREEESGMSKHEVTIWDDYLHVQARKSDQFPSSITWGCDALWFFGGFFVPTLRAGTIVEHIRDPNQLVSPEYIRTGQDLESTTLMVRAALPAAVTSSRSFGIDRNDYTGFQAARITQEHHGDYVPARPLVQVVNGIASLTADGARFADGQSNRFGGGAAGIRSLISGTPRFGLDRRDRAGNDTRVRWNAATAMGPELTNMTRMSTSEQFSFVMSRLANRWWRLAQSVRLRGPLIWLSESFSVTEGPALDFMAPMRELVLPKGRGAAILPSMRGGLSQKAMVAEVQVQDKDRYAAYVDNFKERDSMTPAARFIKGLKAVADAEAKQREHDSAAAVVARLESKISELEATAAKAKADNAVNREVDSVVKKQLSSTVAELTAELRKMDEERAQMKKELDALAKSLKDMNGDIAKKQAEIKASVKDAA